jgi:hypothetical protein
MIDRLVCADGGNPDPDLDPRQEAEEAKALELKGWDYPKHLARRVYGLCRPRRRRRHRRARAAPLRLARLDGPRRRRRQARLDRFIGYYEPYATSHDALDRDEAVQEETRNVARAVAQVTGGAARRRARRRHRGTPSPRPK